MAFRTQSDSDIIRTPSRSLSSLCYSARIISKCRGLSHVLENNLNFTHFYRRLSDDYATVMLWNAELEQWTQQSLVFLVGRCSGDTLVETIIYNAGHIKETGPTHISFLTTIGNYGCPSVALWSFPAILSKIKGTSVDMKEWQGFWPPSST